jgi:superfamily II DNA or RNA helicase
MALTAARALEEHVRTDLRVKIIVPKVFLASQWADAIRQVYGAPRTDIGICSGAVKESGRKFTVYVVNTARGTAARHIVRDFAAGRAVFLIGDECHHLGSEENAHVFDFLPLAGPDNYFALGLSATPDCEGYERVLVPALGREICVYDLKAAARERIVAEFVPHGVGLGFTQDESDEYYELSLKLGTLMRNLGQLCPDLVDLDSRLFFYQLIRLAAGRGKAAELAAALRTLIYQRKEIVHLARARLICARALARRLPPRSRVIYFLERISMADELYAALRVPDRAGIRRYHSGMSREEKRRALDDYRDGEARTLICCHALDEGLDVPDTDTGVIVSTTASPRQRIQRLGRILRRGGSRRVKDIYYFYIAESVEEAFLLPGLPQGEDLFFNHETDRFHNPLYDALAADLRQELRDRGLETRRLNEVERHLRRGAIRGDYRAELPEESAAPAERSERNYWVTMRLLQARQAARDALRA